MCKTKIVLSGLLLVLFGAGICWGGCLEAVKQVRTSPDKVIESCSKAIEYEPGDRKKQAVYYTNRGHGWNVKGQYPKAIADYQRAIELDPAYAPPYNAVAWLWAVCPMKNCRNGVQAVKYAQKALSLKKSLYTKDTLAAAYAEVGNFKMAIKIQRQIIDTLKFRNAHPDTIAGYKERLDLYQNGMPWRKK